MSAKNKPQLSFFKTRPVLVYSLILTMVFAGLGVFRSMHVTNVSAEVATQDAEGARLRENVRDSAKLPGQLEELTNVNAAIRSRLVDPNDLAGNQQYCYKFETESGVRLVDLRRISNNQISAGTNAKPGIYSSLTYAMSVQGTYEQVLAYLRKLESGPRFCRILDGNLVLQNNQNSNDNPRPLLMLSLTVEFLAMQ